MSKKGKKGAVESPLIQTFDQLGRLHEVMPENQALREIREYSLVHGDAPFAVPVVHLILCDREGRLRLVRRGDTKENPRLIDKTVGGHLDQGETPAQTIERETKEEQGVELVVIEPDEYDDMLCTFDVRHVAVARQVSKIAWFKSVRKMANGESFIKRVIAHNFVGVYDGAFRPDNDEALEERRFSFYELNAEFKNNPDLFTEDIKILVPRLMQVLNQETNHKIPATL